MAMTKTFNGSIIRVPGSYGPGKPWQVRFMLIQFLKKLDVKVRPSRP